MAVAIGALLTMIMASRVMYGMAEEGLLMAFLGKVLPGPKTPWTAIVTTTVVAMLLTLVGDLSVLASTVVLLLFVFNSTNLAVLVLRRDRVDHKHFRVPAFVPVLGVASWVLLLTQQEGRVWLYGLGLLLVGVMLFVITRLVGARTGADHSTR